MNPIITINPNSKVTRLVWKTHDGKIMEHSLGYRCSLCYALDLFRRSIRECQGVLSVEQRQNSQFELIEVQNVVEDYVDNDLPPEFPYGEAETTGTC
jgi:hypothetical protein